MNCINEFLTLLIIFLFGLICSCQSQVNKKLLFQEIETLQEQLAQDLNAVKLDTARAITLVNKSEQFATRFSNDTLAAIYLFRAADVARGIGQYQRAIKLWQRVEQYYPDFEKVPEALFFQGFTYENDLKQAELARTYYEQFIEKYPTHPLLPTVQASLSSLTESPEDLIKKFKKLHHDNGDK